MAGDRGKAVIGPDLVVYGDLRNARDVEVLGSVIGSVDSENVTIHPTGRVEGALSAGNAEVKGHLQGRIRVRDLIDIGADGVVRGDVRYGQLALAAGGDLAASVRNVPPQLDGDFEMTVRRGRTTMVTSSDLSASDEEDQAAQLTYHVSNLQHGFLALNTSLRTAVESFSQADIAEGRVNFVHDGGDQDLASFDVVVTDSHGAASGAPRRVTVAVIDAG